MEKYENLIKIEEIRKLIEDNQYTKALRILKTIDVNKVKSMTDLSIIADVYSNNNEYDEAMKVLNRIYGKNKTRRVIYQLVDLSIKKGDALEAQFYLDRYIKVAPNDSYRYIFRYCIDKLKGESYEVLIKSLEQLKEYEYFEVWAYELAKLYHKAGMKDKCVRECSDIILWFGEGVYVEKAKLLKAYYVGELDPINILKAREKKETYTKLGLDKTKDYSSMRVQIDQYLAKEQTSVQDDEEETYSDKDKLDIASTQEKRAEQNEEKVLINIWDSYEDNTRKEEIQTSVQRSAYEELYSAGVFSYDNMEDEGISDEDSYNLHKKEELYEAESLVIAVNIDDCETIAEDELLEVTDEIDGDKETLEEFIESENHQEHVELESAEEYVELESIEEHVGLGSAEEHVELESIEEYVELGSLNGYEELESIEKHVGLELAEEHVESESLNGYEELESIEEHEELEFIEENKEDSKIEYKKDKIHYKEMESIKEITEESSYIKVDYVKTEDNLLKGNGYLKKYFGYFACNKESNIQIEKVLTRVLSQKGKGEYVIITGKPRSGKTTLAKNIGKLLYDQNIVKSSKVAKISSEKLNKMQLNSKIEHLLHSILIIEKAELLSNSTVQQLQQIISTYGDKLFVILEGSKEGIDELFTKHRSLKQSFQSEIDLPRYTREDRLGFVLCYLEESEYKLSKEGNDILYNAMNEIEKNAEECNQLEFIMDFVKKAKLSADIRNKGLLMDIVQSGELRVNDFLYIQEEDFY